MQEKHYDLPSDIYSKGFTLVDTLGSEVVPSMSPELEIAMKGTYRGRVANLGYCIGRRSQGWSSTSVAGDISNYLDTSQASNTPVVTGTEYFVVSSSTEDSPTGTGARSIRVNYLNATGIRSIMNVVMNGTTAVSLGTDISFVQYIETNLVGSAGLAVGDISVSSTSGVPTVDQTIDKLQAGTGRSMSGRVKVPTGFTLYLLGWFSSAIGTNMDCNLLVTTFTDNRQISPGFHIQHTMYLASGQNSTHDFDYLKVPEGSIIKISAIPGNAPAGNRCDANFHFLLISNT